MMLRSLLWTTLGLACLLLTACDASTPVKAGTVTEVASGQTLRAPDSTSASGAYSGVSEYRIGAQDLIEISVFQVPDLSRAVRVNTGGQISLPLIGVVQAGGRTVQELEADIAKKLDANFLQNPQVTVFVKEFTSQRVTVEGAVRSPGIFPLSGRTTLLQTIALAGGLEQLADLRGVVIFRVIDGKKMAAVFDMQAIRAGKSSDPEVFGDDIVVVEQSGSKTALRNFLQVVPVFAVFGVL